MLPQSRSSCSSLSQLAWVPVHFCAVEVYKNPHRHAYRHTGSRLCSQQVFIHINQIGQGHDWITLTQLLRPCRSQSETLVQHRRLQNLHGVKPDATVTQLAVGARSGVGPKHSPARCPIRQVSVEQSQSTPHCWSAVSVFTLRSRDRKNLGPRPLAVTVPPETFPQTLPPSKYS